MISESNTQYVIVTKAEYKRLMKLKAIRRQAKMEMIRAHIEANKKLVQRLTDFDTKDKPRMGEIRAKLQAGYSDQIDGDGNLDMRGIALAIDKKALFSDVWRQMWARERQFIRKILGIRP